MDFLVLGIGIGILAYVMQYSGKGFQKYAIEGIKDQKSVKNKNSGIWILGTILTATSVLVQWIPLAIFHLPVNLIAPLEGLGLITLLLFSYFVLKEPLGKSKLIGVGFIIIGTVVINLKSQAPVELLLSQLHLTEFWIFLASITVIGTVGFLIFRKKSILITAVIFGFLAGSANAFTTLSKRITDIDEMAAIFSVATMVFSMILFIITQIALAKGNANVVIPVFTSASIILTSVMGIAVIEEGVSFLQIVGIGIILVGIIFLFAFQKTLPQEENSIENEIIQEEI